MRKQSGRLFLIFCLVRISKLYQNCRKNLWFLGLNSPSGPFRTHEPFLQQKGNIWPSDRSNRPSGLINSWIIDCLDKLFIHLHIFVFLIHLHIFVSSRAMNLLWKKETQIGMREGTFHPCPFWIRFCQLISYQKTPNFFEGKNWQ